MNVSIIVPVYNDPDGIDQTLHSVAQQSYSDFEIIPVDNNSSDETPSVISEWAERYDHIRPTEEHEIQSSYAARNAGIRHAGSELLVFIDADMTVPEDWLQRIANAFETMDVDYLGYEIKTYIPDGEDSLWGWYDQVMGLPTRYYYEEKQFVPTSCLAVRESVFNRVGLFKDRLISGGDSEFGHRVHDHPDLKTAFAEDIVVYHPARTTFGEHYKKAFRIGRGLAQVQKTKSDGGPTLFLFSLLEHLLPPNPLRIYRQVDSLAPYQYALLYVMNVIIRYIRAYGALIQYFRKPPNDQ